MIEYDPSRLSVQHVWIKNVTTALGGSMTIVDKEKSTPRKEVTRRIPVPLAVARAFIKLYQTSRYLKPTLAAVAFYDDQALSIERHPEGPSGEEFSIGLSGEEEPWRSITERNVRRLNDNIYKTISDWFIDGTFVFRPVESAHEQLSGDGHFSAVACEVFKLSTLFDPIDGGTPADRKAIRYHLSDGSTAMSCPIWTSLDGVGSRQMDGAGNDIEYQFDKIDTTLAVSLAFVLKAAKEVSSIFGFETIDPLRLDRLMIELNTVNLPNISKEIKATYNVGIPATHLIAWLIGLAEQCDNLGDYMTIRALLKYLTTKGIFRRKATSLDSLLKEGTSIDDVKAVSIDQLEERIENMDIATRAAIRAIGTRNRGSRVDRLVATTLDD